MDNKPRILPRFDMYCVLCESIVILFRQDAVYRWCMVVVSSCRKVSSLVWKRAQPSSLVSMSNETASVTGRKERMTSDPHAPYV